MSNFNVYVIHSAKPVKELQDCLTNAGGFYYAGIIYKSFSHHRRQGKSKEETKKTIVFCPATTIQKLIEMHPDFKERVADYNWESFPCPTEESGETWNLHISGVPNDFTSKDAEGFIIESIKCVLPRESDGKINYYVDFTPRSRETGQIYGFGKVCFEKHVDHEVIKLCKLVLHNTPLSFKNAPESRKMVTCVWHREPASLGASRYYDSHRPYRARRAYEPQGHDSRYGSRHGPIQGRYVRKKIASPNYTNRDEPIRRARPATVQRVDVSNLEVVTKDGVVSPSQ